MKYYEMDNYPIEFILSENIEKRFDRHNHIGHYIIALVLSGRIELCKDDENVICQKDDIFIISPYISHTIVQDKNARLLSLCVGVSILESYSLEEARDIVNSCIQNLYNKKIVELSQGEAYLHSLNLVYEFHQTGKVGLKREIEKLTDIIIKQPEDEISLSNLAENIFVSKYYLIKRFKNDVGMTPHQFQIQNRIRKAQHLLSQGKTIAEISAEMGFYDQSHFCKYFNKIVGVTPSEYISSKEKL